MKKDYVTITIPRRFKGEGERFIGCNGRRFLVKCGTPVEVPAAVAEVYFNSVRQREAAESRISDLAVI